MDALRELAASTGHKRPRPSDDAPALAPTLEVDAAAGGDADAADAAPQGPAAAAAASASAAAGTAATGGGGLARKKKPKKLTPEGVALLTLKDGLTSCITPEPDFARALQLVRAALAAGMVPTAHFYGILLNIATRATRLEPQVMRDAVQVFSHMVAQGTKVPEASYTSMIKICALAASPDEGRRMLDQMCAAGIEPRLRSYVGLVEAFAQPERSDLASLRELFEHMRARGVLPSQAEYAHLLRTLRRHGREAEGLQLLRSCMPTVHVLEPSLAAAAAFFFGGGEGGDNTAVVQSSASSASSASAASAAPFSQWRCARTLVRRAVGQCSVTGRHLRSLDLEPAELEQLAAKCQALACTSPAATAQFEDFRRLLAQRGQYDVIVDGANVGFFGQNHFDGGLCYSHIDAVVRHFEAQGLRVLVVMNDKWLQPRVFLNADMRRPFKRRINYYAAKARGEEVDYSKIPRPTSGRHGGGAGRANAWGGAGEGGGGGDGGGGGGAAAVTSWMAPSGGSDEENASEGGSDGSCEEGDGGEGGEDEGGDSVGVGAGGFTSYDCHVADSVEGDSALAAEIVARWRAERTVYSVPRGNNDDWFWMYAAVAQPDPMRVRLVSNDFMRDHHFHIFQAWSTFQTWRERHQVGFAILRRGSGGGGASAGAGAGAGAGGANATLQLRFPLHFSFRMQPSEDGAAWHFPLARAAAALTAAAAEAAAPEAGAPAGLGVAAASAAAAAAGDGTDEWLCAWRVPEPGTGDRDGPGSGRAGASSLQ